MAAKVHPNKRHSHLRGHHLVACPLRGSSGGRRRAKPKSTRRRKPQRDAYGRFK